MSPSKMPDDPVMAEYDVYLTPPTDDLIYLLQYPNRSRNNPYDHTHNSSPSTLRLKPRSGYIEADVSFHVGSDYNKQLGLKWGEAMRVSREVHNSTGTYGPASGLTMARPRAIHRNTTTGANGVSAPLLKDEGTRLQELDHDLANFDAAARAGRPLTTQTLGGQILSSDTEGCAAGGVSSLGGASAGPKSAQQFVGTFRGSKLFLTKLSGVAQLRPQFHYVDAETERVRIAAMRAASAAHDGDGGGGGAGGSGGATAFTVKQRVQSEAEKNTLENRMRKMLVAAEQEAWVKVEYVHEDEAEAYGVFQEKFFVGGGEGEEAEAEDAVTMQDLKSPMSKEEYLDAISTPRHANPTRKKRRPPRGKDAEEDGAGEDVEMIDVDE